MSRFANSRPETFSKVVPKSAFSGEFNCIWQDLLSVFSLQSISPGKLNKLGELNSVIDELDSGRNEVFDDRHFIEFDSD